MTQCAAVELGPKGVRVNAISPALIETPIFQTPGMIGGNSSYAEFARTCYPIGRIGQVTDTTAGILFLASDQVQNVIPNCSQSDELLLGIILYRCQLASRWRISCNVTERVQDKPTSCSIDFRKFVNNLIDDLLSATCKCKCLIDDMSKIGKAIFIMQFSSLW